MASNALKQTPLEVDVAIVGGGLVGASLCLALQESGYSVALIESSNFQSMDKPSFDARSIALSLSSINFFKRFSLWQSLEPFACAMKTIHVSEKGNFGRVKLKAQDFKVESLGYVIELHALNKALHQTLKKNERLHLLTEKKVTEVAIQDRASLTLRGKDESISTLSAKLIVAADGANSCVRRLLNLTHHLKEVDFKKDALVCNVGLKREPNEIAYERFTKTGPLALLPLPSKRASLVWSVDKEQAKTLLECREQDFINALQEAFGYRLGRMNSIGKRALFPLKANRMSEVVFDKLIFIGNAAQSLHPIAGQGFNLALRDVAHLSELLNHGEIEDALFANYRANREQDRKRTIGLSEGLLHSFINQSELFKGGRGGAMSLLDLSPSLKRLLITQAGGLGGKVPRVMYPR